MSLHIVQKGQGATRPLVLGFLMSASIDPKLRSAFGPEPCIITSSSDETPDLGGIAEWAYKYAGLQAISRLALLGFSAGCQRVRSMYRDEGVRADAYLLVDGTHASLPPLPLQIDWLRELCSSAKGGYPLVVASHTLQTYVEKLPADERFASTLRVLRLATGFDLAEAGSLDAPMVTRAGQLWVYSFASTQIEAAAHMAQHDRVLPTLAGAHLGPWLARTSSGSSASSQAAAGALDLVGVELVNGDPLYVRLAPLGPGAASAWRWIEAWNDSMSILAARWLTVPGPAAKYLRAVPEQVEGVLGSSSSSFFVLASRGRIARWGGRASDDPTSRQADWPTSRLADEPMILPWDLRWPESGPPYVVIPRASPIGNRFDKVPARLCEPAIYAYLSDEPPRMLAAAEQLEAANFPKVGDFVRERALQINTLRVAAVGGKVYRLRDDWEQPSGLALWFAGDGHRWRELLAVNSALRVEKGWRPEAHEVRPWRKGLTIVLPPGWNELCVVSGSRAVGT